jgi:coenzyme F420-reducing hydrogenase alpha subunit
MDLRNYFKKIKDTESSIDEPYLLVVSSETPDGGKAGAVIEVSRREAAKAMVEGRATPANQEQKEDYYKQEAARKKSAEKAELSRRLQIAIISDSELRTSAKTEEKDEQPKGLR